MKETFMKRFILSALATAMFLAPALQSQAAPLIEPSRPQSNLVQVGWKPVVEKEVVVKKKVVVRHGPNRTVVVHKWRNGQRYANWNHYRPVEYRRYGLHRPGPGQHWIRVDNDYLLVGIASGIIAGVVAAN
jgi:Ni/Co efflux regulator RcnB